MDFHCKTICNGFKGEEGTIKVEVKGTSIPFSNITMQPCQWVYYMLIESSFPLNQIALKCDAGWDRAWTLVGPC